MPYIFPIYSLRIPDYGGGAIHRALVFSFTPLPRYRKVVESVLPLKRPTLLWQMGKAKTVQQYSWTTAGPEVPTPRA